MVGAAGPKILITSGPIADIREWAIGLPLPFIFTHLWKHSCLPPCVTRLEKTILSCLVTVQDICVCWLNTLKGIKHRSGACFAANGLILSGYCLLLKVPIRQLLCVTMHVVLMCKINSVVMCYNRGSSLSIESHWNLHGHGLYHPPVTLLYGINYAHIHLLNTPDSSNTVQ